jgi:hypothetical protein
LVAAVGFAAPASAQATRTWVSGVGDDANPCSRTAPCKTFAGAISKTAAGGEINCLDPGGFGAVTITKSMTISCPYTEGGALAGGNGIVVNAAATDVVYIRGLDIFGVNPPLHGIRFVAGGALHVEDSVIRRFNGANSFGISFAPSTNAELFVSNTTIAENGSVGTGGGIDLIPGAGGSVQAVIRNVRLRNNGKDGLHTFSANGSVSFVVDDSDLSGNQHGIAASAESLVTRGMVTNSVIASNSIAGILTSGSNATVRVDGSTITANSQGVSALGGSQLLSYGGNRLDGNPVNGAANDGAFTGAVIPRR